MYLPLMRLQRHSRRRLGEALSVFETRRIIGKCSSRIDRNCVGKDI